MKKENDISACVRKTVTDYFKHLDGEKPCSVYDAVLQSMEKPLIEVVLDHAGGNQTKAAEILGVNRNTLRKKMQQYRIA
jgi:Fis family transcriptional regulator, factor for inversion stimulation protein